MINTMHQVEHRLLKEVALRARALRTRLELELPEPLAGGVTLYLRELKDALDSLDRFYEHIAARKREAVVAV